MLLLGPADLVWFIIYIKAFFLRTRTIVIDANNKIQDNIIASRVEILHPGDIPVLGNLGITGDTTTVAIATSLTERPLASPLATAVFIVVLERLVRQVYVHVSVVSSF